MVIVILVIQVNLSKHRTKVMISSRQGGNHNHCNCHPHYQSHRYRTEVFDLCFYHCWKVSVNVIITIIMIIINIMILMIINTTASPPGWLILQTRADVAVRNRVSLNPSRLLLDRTPKQYQTNICFQPPVIRGRITLLKIWERVISRLRKSSEVMTILSATLVTIHKSYLDRPNGNWDSEIHLFQ